MILTCPSCGTQYVVKDGAIPPEGRQVRCAACKHSWHQDPEEDATGGAPTEGETGPAAERETAAEPTFEEQPEAAGEDENLAEATLIDLRSGPEAEERAYEEAMIEGDAGVMVAADAVTNEAPPAAEEPAEAEAAAPSTDWDEPPTAEAVPDMFSPFAEEGDAEPGRRSPLVTILAVLAAVIVLAALFWFLAPDPLKAKLGLSAADATPLAVVMSHMDRQQLESGNELLTVTGRVINPTAREQDVPPLQAQLTSKSGQVVYSWTIAPPARSLAAGASASFNSAEIIKSGGDELTISLGPPKA
jgi:predicted Zn finger-like uncharacterized protein